MWHTSHLKKSLYIQSVSANFQHYAVGSCIGMWLLCHPLSVGHIFWRFCAQHPVCMFLSCSVSLTVPRLSTPWSRMLGSQVTNTQILPDPIFLESYDCNKATTDSDAPSFFLLSLPLFAIMALHRSVMCEYIFFCLMILKLKFGQ